MRTIDASSRGGWNNSASQSRRHRQSHQDPGARHSVRLLCRCRAPFLRSPRAALRPVLRVAWLSVKATGAIADPVVVVAGYVPGCRRTGCSALRRTPAPADRAGRSCGRRWSRAYPGGCRACPSACGLSAQVPLRGCGLGQFLTGRVPVLNVPGRARRRSPAPAAAQAPVAADCVRLPTRWWARSSGARPPAS